MSYRSLLIGGVALLLILGASPGSAQECADCHEDQARSFATNPHAKQVACAVCHGDGAAHIEGGGDITKISVPRGFAGAETACLTCHDRTTDRRSHRMGAHANSPAVNCLSCHSIHHAEEPAALVKLPQAKLCAGCHGTQSASTRNRPHAHRVVACATCHDPHARAGRENIRVTAAGETACVGCHSDKRGPFVFEHGGTALGEADCSSCHEPHGSSNPNQLKRARVAQLCLECHSPLTGTTAGSQPPSFHNLTNPRYQNCTTCHVAIHGSNRSPQLLK